MDRLLRTKCSCPAWRTAGTADEGAATGALRSRCVPGRRGKSGPVRRMFGRVTVLAVS